MRLSHWDHKGKGQIGGGWSLIFYKAASEEQNGRDDPVTSAIIFTYIREDENETCGPNTNVNQKQEEKPKFSDN